MLAPSAHNLIGPLPGDGERWYVVNLLAGSADLLSAGEAADLQAGRDPDGAYAARGYLVDPQDEARRYRAAYLDFLDARATDEVQLFFAPSYACNLGCTYCYQEPYPGASPGPRDEVLDALFDHVGRAFGDRRKYLTLFGGEPLLPGPAARGWVEGVVDRCVARGLDLAVVTNGVHVREYLPTLARATIREVQITLDGPRETHDRRRPRKDGAGTFDAVVAAVDATLAAGLPVNLRVVVDRENVADLVPLAELAAARGWTGNPGFKTQLGRNYELHHAHSAGAILSRLELYQEVHGLAVRNPNLLAFHRPAFSVSRFLFEGGELPGPLFDSCPGTKTEWAFDASGRVYACTATIGKPGEELGTFWPEVHLDGAAVGRWEDRDVLAIPECRDCNARLACGGGCASVARNRTGRLDAPDCRPIRDLLALGIDLYGPGGAGEKAGKTGACAPGTCGTGSCG